MRKRRGSGRPTIADVAAYAGVSAITVSRAMRMPKQVTEATRSRIAKAVEDLGYIPDPAAQALASARSQVIGVLIPSITNSVFADVMTGIYEAVVGTSYQVQIANSRYSEDDEERLLRTFLNQRPAGLIVTGVDQTPNTRALLATADCPVVQIMDVDGTPVDMMVGFDHAAASAAATEHVLAQGYKQPTYLGARMDPRSQKRMQGFCRVMNAAGLYNDTSVRTSEAPASSAPLGAQLLAELLDGGSTSDAVICNNDDIAIGVLFEAQRRGIKVGTELGICGFNDIAMMDVAHPGITSVRTKRREMGRVALDMVLERLGKPDSDIAVHDLGFEVMSRASTRRS